MSKFKKIIICLCVICFCFVVHAETLTINWLNEDYSPLTTTTCESGGDIVLPSIPSKPGHTFKGWKLKDFIRVEYVESSPSSVVDTGIPADQYVRVTADISAVGGSGTLVANPITGDYVYSLRIDTNTDNIVYTAYWNSNRWSNTADGKQTTVPTGRQIIDFSKDGFFVNDELKISFNTAFFSFQNIKLFSNSLRVRIYSLKIYQNNVLVRDFVPAIDSSQTPGFYDLVSKQFFYNTGSGSLSAGPVIE